MTGLESLISEMEKDEKFCLGDTTSRRRWIDMARRLAAEEKAPSADRTEELVKRLRELRRIWGPKKGHYLGNFWGSFDEILSDFEKGAK